MRIFLFVVFGVLVAAAVLVGLRPVAEPKGPDLRRPVSTTLWLIPLAGLNLLFASFVTVQLTVLFGGSQRVLSTAGLTYAEYARSGFFELVTVSFFVLGIVAGAVWLLKLKGRADQRILAVLLGLLATIAGPFLVVPALATATAAMFVLAGSRDPWRVIALGCAPTIVPFVLERLSLSSHVTTTATGDTLTIHPWMASFPPVPTYALLVPTSITAIARRSSPGSADANMDQLSGHAARSAPQRVTGMQAQRAATSDWPVPS